MSRKRLSWLLIFFLLFMLFVNMMSPVNAGQNVLSMILRPIGDASTSFTPVGGANNTVCVDDVTQDYNTTYTTVVSSVNQRDKFYMENAVGVTDEVIVNVTIRTCGMSSNVQNDYISIWGGGGAFEEFVISTYGTVGYSNRSYVWVNDPDGGAWTWADINETYIGYRGHTNNPSWVRITQIYAQVYYYSDLNVTTNSTTGVEEANATLHGYLIDNGSVDCTVRFEYGTTTAYGTNTTNQTLSDVTNFSANITGLSPGTQYHYRSYANDSTGNYSYGDDMSFYTKPEAPTSVSAYSVNNNSTCVMWTVGTGADNTVIVRNDSSWDGVPTSVTNGTIVYNGSGTWYYDSVSPGFDYNYSLWSFTYDSFSDNYTSVDNVSCPQNPSSVDGFQWVNNLNISWTAGRGATNTLVVGNNNSNPSSPSDGVLLYNGTNSYYNVTLVPSYYYSLFSFNSTNSLHSLGVTFNWGSLIIYCYDENTSVDLTFDVLISNEDGSETYQDTSCTNPHYIPVEECPLGDDIAIYINDSAGIYEPRVHYMDLANGIQYTLYSYLTLITQSELYLLRVIDENSDPVVDAKVGVIHYINETMGWENVTVLYSDGNGYVEVFLMPGEWYKVNISKSGYQSSINDYFPSDDVFDHTFQLLFEEYEPKPPDVEPEDIVFTGYIDNSTGYLHVNFSDAMNQTTNTTITIWEKNYSTSPYGLGLVYTYSQEGDSFHYVVPINISCGYVVYLYLNHTTFGYQVHTVYLEATNKSTITTQSRVDSLFQLNYGSNPFGWSNCLMWIFLVGCFYSFGRRGSGIGLVFTGGLLILVNSVVGFNTVFALAFGGAFPVLFIIIGVMMIWRDSRKEVTG